MDVNEAQPWTGAPVAEQPLLDMLHFQRFAQQRICAQVDHPRRQVIAGPPIGVDLAELILDKASGGARFASCDLRLFFIL